ncbi:MAG: hypothetical protein DI598_00455 [Pseudopedobacter saltans]|uniref:RNA polymerase, sigma-24 subunit, ECF subfamily n=1 Tax=Pseudopedobacter saltans TaxID=151895 RepID=A0A2W5FFQ5_9SPHI|nr:MAG: hypothetical protein DI598_00455 [Pseudopedobacter saltans]
MSTDTLTRFNDIYGKYNKSVYLNISKYIHDDIIADDIFQEVFMRLWESLQSQEIIHSYSSWLYVVSRNKSISYLKKTIKENKVVLLKDECKDFESEMPTYDNKASHELVEAQLQSLYNAVDRLPRQKRIVFYMHKFEGKDIEEIATLLDLNPLSVKEYLKQAKRSIKLILNQNNEMVSSLFALGLILCSVGL